MTKKDEEDLSRSRIVCLKNMLVLENLKSRQEFYDVEEDVYEECRKFGRIRSILIPKPAHMNFKKLPLHIQFQKYGTFLMNDGAGKIYVKFERSESARKCLEGITQRLYCGREVYAT